MAKIQTTIKLNPKNFQARRELIMLCLDMGFEKVEVKPHKPEPMVIEEPKEEEKPKAKKTEKAE